MLELKLHIAVYLLLTIFLWVDRVIKESIIRVDKDLLLVSSGLFLFGECIAWITYYGFLV